MTEERAKPPPRLILPRPVARRIVAAARRAAPREACGVLVGRLRSGATEVVRERRARNVHPRPTERFTVAPRDLLAATRAARGDGLEVVGFWHSHPRSDAAPSAVDAGAAWDGYSYLIVSLAAGRRGELRSWRFPSGAAVEEAIVDPARVAEATG